MKTSKIQIRKWGGLSSMAFRRTRHGACAKGGFRLGLLLGLAFLVAPSAWAQPATVYVDDGYAGLPANTDVNFPYTGSGSLIIGIDAFATIQAAIDAVASAGTVNVAPGTYAESQVVVTRPVKVLGAGAIATILDGGNAILPSLGLVRISAGTGEVTFDGFTLRNAGAWNDGANDLKTCVFAASASVGPIYQISNNKFEGAGVAHEFGCRADGGQEILVLATNEITGMGANAVLVDRHPGAVQIQDNRVDVGVPGATAILVTTSGGVDVTSAQKVIRNRVDAGTGGPFDASHACNGIAFIGAADGTAGRFTNVEIAGNTVVNVRAHRRGIVLRNNAPQGQAEAGEIVDAVIGGNWVSDASQSVFFNSGVRLAGQVRNVSVLSNRLDILLYGVEQIAVNGHSAIATMVASGNQIHYCVRGVGILAGSASVKDNLLMLNTAGVMADGRDTRVLIEGNDLSGMYGPGLYVENAAIVDAGDCLNRNVTGLGSSLGGNTLTGYGFDDIAPFAVECFNYSWMPNILAWNNNFGALADNDIERLIEDGTDFAWLAQVEFGQAGPLLAACPSARVVQNSINIPPPAATWAEFLAQGGVVSASSGSVASVDNPFPYPAGDFVVTRTYTLTDACGKTAQCSQTITVDNGVPPVLVGCPPPTAAYQSYADVPPPPEVTVEGNPTMPVDFTEEQSNPGSSCNNVITRTWTASNGAGAPVSCQQVITVNDTTPPVLRCPPNVIVPYESLVPPVPVSVEEFFAQGGYVSDKSQVSLAVEDSQIGGDDGDCKTPLVVTRTYTATDECGQINQCRQTIKVICPSLITDTSFCSFDVDPSLAGNQFRLNVHQQVDAPSLWRLSSSNPGQFVYNVFYTGLPGAEFCLNITIPSPFVTQGANPIHVYDAFHIMDSPALRDGYCVKKGYEITREFTVTTAGGNKSASGAPVILLNDYRPATLGATTSARVCGKVPASGLVLVVLHLDYGLKGTKGWQRTSVDPDKVVGTARTTSAGFAIAEPQTYVFSFGDGGSLSDTQQAQSLLEFKKNPGFGGLVHIRPDFGDSPVVGAKVEAYDARWLKVGEGITDEDGAYYILYKHTAKAADYWIKLPAYNKLQKVTIKANGFGFAEFIVP